MQVTTRRRKGIKSVYPAVASTARDCCESQVLLATMVENAGRRGGPTRATRSRIVQLDGADAPAESNPLPPTWPRQRGFHRAEPERGSGGSRSPAECGFLT